MGFPVRLNFVNGSGEGFVWITDKNRSLILPAIWMKIVPMTEAMCIVKADDGLPYFLIMNFQLHSEFQNTSGVTLIPTADARLLGQEFVYPLALDQAGVGHRNSSASL